MRILIRMTAGLSPSLAPLARRRLEFALGRFGAPARSLTVRLADLNAARGVDKHCLADGSRAVRYVEKELSHFPFVHVNPTRPVRRDRP